MKKITAAVVLTALSIGIFSTPLPAAGKGSCSGVIRLIQKYDDRDGVEAVNLGGFLLGIAKIAASGEEGSEWLDYLDRMAVFTAEDASEETKAEFTAELMAVLGEYEKAAEMKDGTDDMSIWMKMKDEETIKEMVMVSNSESAIIFLGGNIPMSEMADVVTNASQQ